MWRELSEMETDDCACAPTWFTGPQNATAKAIRDRRDLIAEIERLRAALEQIAANNDFLFLAEMAEFAREALAVNRLEPKHAVQLDLAADEVERLQIENAVLGGTVDHDIENGVKLRREISQLRASLLACTNALKAYTPGDYAPGQQIIRKAMQLLGPS